MYQNQAIFFEDMKTHTRYYIKWVLVQSFKKIGIMTHGGTLVVTPFLNSHRFNSEVDEHNNY